MNSFLTLKRIVLVVLTIIVSTASKAQTGIDSISLRENIKIAFKEHKETHKEIIEYEYEKELQKAYVDGINELKPELFYDKNEASNLIKYYSTISGIKIILEEWFHGTDQNWEEIYSIDMKIYIKIYFATKSPDINPNMRANSPNNYSILFLSIAPKSFNLDIYIDNRFIGNTNNAEKGIRLPSDKTYRFELKIGAKNYCSENIALSKQERRTKTCIIEN